MIVTLLGLVISLFAYLIAFPHPDQRRFDIYCALLALHIAATVGYWLLSFESAMDAYLYYRDPFGFYASSAWDSGTYFIVHVVQSMRTTLGGSFLDHFLFFQCFGMVGIALLIRCLNEVADSFGMKVPPRLYLILFLPGLHFWTVAIGKDGPMIMAICLSIWAALNIQKRMIWMAVAIAIMLPIRPHVAAMVMVGLAGALFITKHVSSRVRIALAPLALAGLVFVVAEASERFGITSDGQSVSEFIETEQGHGERFGSGADLQSQPLPLKMFALLFRPLFIDAQGLMGLVASFENMFLLFIFGYIVYHWRLVVGLIKNVYYVVYTLIFGSALILGLSLVNYNIGLGLRQKMMAIPAVLIVFATVYLYKQYLEARQLQMAEHPGSSEATYAAPVSLGRL